MRGPRRRGASRSERAALLAVASAVVAFSGCASGSSSSTSTPAPVTVSSATTVPASSTVAAGLTTTGPPPTAADTAAPSPTSATALGGAAGALFAPLTGYQIDEAPPGTADDLLTTVKRIPSAGDVIDSVDVRLVTGTADASASLVVSVALRPVPAERAAAFADAVTTTLGPGFVPQPVAMTGVVATYVEGPDPVGGTIPLRAIVVHQGLRLALVLGVQGDRAALERLTGALAPRFA